MMKKNIFLWVVFFAIVMNLAACGHKGTGTGQDSGSKKSKAPLVLSVFPKTLVSGETTTLTMSGDHLTPDMEVQLGDGVKLQGKIIVTGNGRQATAAVTVSKTSKPGPRKLVTKNDKGKTSGDLKIAIAGSSRPMIRAKTGAGIQLRTDLSVYRDNLATYSSFPTWPGVPGYYTDTFIPSGKGKDLEWSFKWSTSVKDVEKAVWQVSTLPFSDELLPNQAGQWRSPQGLVAFGTLTSVPGKGKQREFTIDFSKFVSASPANLPYSADQKKLLQFGTVKMKATPAKSVVSGKFVLQGYKTYYVRLIPLDDNGNPAGNQSNLVAVGYGSYDEYYSSNYSSPELGIDLYDFNKDVPILDTEFPDVFAQSGKVSTDTGSAGGGWPAKSAWFRWKAPLMNSIRSAVWQISSTPFPGGADKWTNPPGLLDSGIVKNKISRDGYQYFMIDFKKAVSTLKVKSLKDTYYIRIAALDIRGQLRGKPSQQVTLVVDHTQQGSPWITTKTVPVTCTGGLTVEIPGYVPQRLPDSNYTYYYVLVKDVPPGNHTMDGLWWLSNFKKGDHIYIPPKDDKDFWDYVGDAFSSAFGWVADLVNWVSSAWDSVKGYVINAIASALTKFHLVDCGKGTTCRDLFSAALDAGMLACGIPPTLPNFDMIVDMGKENLVKVISAQVAEQCGLPEDLTEMTAEELLKNDEIKKVASDTADSLLAEAQKGADNYYLFGGYLKPAPERFDRPATVLLKITNKGDKPSKRAKLSIRDSLMLFKTFVFNVPSLAAGESISTSVVLEQDYSHVYDDAYSCSRPYHECHPHSGYQYTPEADWWLQYRQMHDDFFATVIAGSCDCNDQIAKLKQQEDHSVPNVGYAYTCTAAGSAAQINLDAPSEAWGQTKP